jgi:formylglycine-generating enzyme required for sulfatase activity
MLGGVDDSGFVFDNEQWAHEVVVEPFSISRTAVTQAEFAGFVNGPVTVAANCGAMRAGAGERSLAPRILSTGVPQGKTNGSAAFSINGFR